MPTQSNSPGGGQWAPCTEIPRRSVFGNYTLAAGTPSSSAAARERNQGSTEPARPLQAAIELAVARSFVYRFLAKAYEDPTCDGWDWLCRPTTLESLTAAWNIMAPDEPAGLAFLPDGFDRFHNACLAVFGHAARGSCPLNEIEYGELKADPLFQPHRLADLAGFYHAFGLEVTEDAGERHDHLCLELEFMCVLAAKEAYALEYQLDETQMQLCLDAQNKFLREHLGRWTPAFTRRLAAATDEPALRNLADFTRRLIERECARFGVTPGSQELALRQVDEVADRMCDSCGLNNLPPGALAPA